MVEFCASDPAMGVQFPFPAPILVWCRSGHNGPDSKSVLRIKPPVGSNPTHTAICMFNEQLCVALFLIVSLGFEPTEKYSRAKHVLDLVRIPKESAKHIPPTPPNIKRTALFCSRTVPLFSLFFHYFINVRCLNVCHMCINR